MNCFPIAMQAGQSDEPIQNEIDFVMEIADSVVDFASGLLSSFKRAKNAPVKAQVTEATKLRMAQSQSTPSLVLVKMTKDSNSSVRSALVFNPALPTAALFALAADSDHFVSAQAKARISMAA